MAEAIITVGHGSTKHSSQENTPLLQGVKETVRCLKPRIAHQKVKTLEHYVRVASMVMVSVALVAMDYTFRNSKLYSHWGFHKADTDTLCLTVPLLIVHTLAVVYISHRLPVRLGSVARIMLQTFTDMVTMIFTGFLSATVTRSRYEVVTDVHSYLLNCPNHLNVSSLAEMRFTPSGCLPPIEISPSTCKPPSNLVDGYIVLTVALLALYSMSLAIFLRPGLKLTLTRLSFVLSYHFLFVFCEDSGCSCFYMLGLVIYSSVLLVINEWVSQKATEGQWQPPLIDRAQTQLQGGKTGETQPDGKRASIKMPMVPAYCKGALTHSGP